MIKDVPTTSFTVRNVDSVFSELDFQIEFTCLRLDFIVSISSRRCCLIIEHYFYALKKASNTIEPLKL